MDQKNQIIFSIVKALDDPVIKFLQKLVVLQTAFLKAHEKFLGPALHLRVQRKFQIDQVLSYGSRQALPENLKILVALFIRLREKRFLHLAFFILFYVNIAGAEPRQLAVLRRQLLFDFGYLFLIHLYLLLSSFSVIL